ncbi:DNA ligase D [Cytophaga aurantiaca]|uniref:DNA ligase D n=1 Tax=Cytophaga aurantiaca TaxID=29530 RepID=UPI000375F81D|nr:DNA ligase D [Cytophaga aurantiaca]
MALEIYKEKRNFKKTPEPAGKKNAAGSELKFVIQRHAASHLHYDFRLEMEGVLKSWAVPKGPSLNPQDKRLAMMVEDHPFAYRTFAGVIPEGNYGAGIVEIWDEGTYHAIGSEDRKESEKMLLAELKKGSLKFVLHGKKLKGEFALVKIKNNNLSKDNAWLLIKHKDEFATEEQYSSEEHVPENSKIIKKDAVAKKTVKAVKKTVTKATKEAASSSKKKAQPKVKIKQGKDLIPHEVKPMLAKLTDGPFDSEEWIFEIKWDGYRAIAEIEKGKVNLYSRNLISFNHKYKSIVKTLESFGHNVVLDGEIVVLNADGTSSFQMLQQYDENPSPNLCYCVFDILYLDGNDLRDLPLTERKKILKEVLLDVSNITYSDHVESEGVRFFELAKKNKLEGIMAKKADSAYRMGSRSGEWLKIKIISAQEAIICGFTAPRNSRKSFGALILGVYEKGRLVYIGHTGGGFTESLLSSTLKLMKPLIQPESPFDVKIKTNEKVTWVKPQLVCEIAFSEWTSEGHMRQPIFKGMRIDKKAKEVTRELPAVAKIPKDTMEAQSKTKKATKKKSVVAKAISKKTSAAKKVVEKSEDVDHSKKATSTEVKINKQVLKITNRSKVYWPEDDYTKGDLIDYYMQISDYILPYLKDRPESLNRHPNGINGSSFYQKDMADSFPDWIEYKEVYSESNDKDIRYMVCQNKETLIYMANLGCIEINPWNSRIQKIKNPDYIVIDLDPSDNNTFEEVIKTALVVKRILDKAGADAYCKTSGATGLHIYIPLGAKYTYEQGKNFAHIIAQFVHDELPELTSLVRNPKERTKQIYVDYLQNRSGQTLAAAYSVRPKPGATVSTPLEWSEVKKGLHPSKFTIKTIFKRLKQKGDLFKGILGKGIDMEKCLKKLGA